MSRRALVVDDEPAIRRLFSRFLATLGFDEVDTAEDGPSAARLLGASAAYDLVLTDLIMPNTEIDDLLQMILEHPSGPAVVCGSGAPGYMPHIQDPRIVEIAYPIGPKDLSAAVRAAEARRPPRAGARGPDPS
jgi:CheY-like chemotaxis protein